LLRSLKNYGIPAGDLGSDWIGGLDISYFTGPGLNVHLNVQQDDYSTRQIWNVIAKIEAEDEEQAVIFGNHRDAWVYGAKDPNSGSAAMLELAFGLGVLLKTGWKPKRTIILASWDAEEYG
jgi:N-acetylated-alpha-linked acidic dipeptidase